MRKPGRENKMILLCSLAAIFVACLPLFTVNCIVGHDSAYHLLRIEALKTDILAGNPFPKVNSLYFGGRGYASSMFYPDLMLYLPALMRCVGVPINLCFNLFAGVCVFAAFFSMFAVTRAIVLRFCGRDGYIAGAAGVASAVIYTLSQYHLDDIYTRSAVGEYTAMIFLPLVLYGLYDMLMGGMKRPEVLTIGFAGLLLCHTTTTIFALILTGCVFIYSLAHRCIRGRMKKGWILRIVFAAFSTLMITAFYWAPMMEQFSFASFHTGAGGFDLDYEKLLLRDVFANKNPALGIAQVLILFLLFILANLYGKERKLRFLGGVLGISGLVCVLGSTGIVSWRALQDILEFVQFPWRLYVMATPLLSMAAALYLACFLMGIKKPGEIGHKTPVTALALVACIMIISAVSNFSRMDQGYYSYSDDYYSYVPFTGEVIGGEWLPSKVTDRKKLTKNCDRAVTAYGGVLTVERDEKGLSLSMPAKAEYVDLPLIYYRGYEAFDEKGESLVCDGLGENGSVRVYSPPEGVLRVRYAGTGTQKASGVLSVVFFALWVVLGKTNPVIKPVKHSDKE